ncbi:hypothetical protein PSDI105340_00415 [Pseudoalteromonas distincta]
MKLYSGIDLGVILVTCVSYAFARKLEKIKQKKLYS